jgi:hypothetical protein
VPLLCEAHRASHAAAAPAGSSAHLQQAARAADTLWQRGLLRKGLGLCPDISGSAFALLSLHRATGDARQLARAQQMGAFKARHWRQLYVIPDRPASLFEGLARAVCLWLELLLVPGQQQGGGAGRPLPERAFLFPG